MTSGRLFLVTLFVYLANGKTIGAVDTLPAKYLPFSLLREANFDFDEFPFLYLNGIPGYLTLSRNHYVSFFTPFAGVVALPIYAVSVLGGVSPSSRLVGDLEKVSASVITALSVAILFSTLRRLADKNDALLISTVYAFGSSTFSMSAQALFSERQSIGVDYLCKEDLPPGPYHAGVYFVRAGGPADFSPLAAGLIHAGGGVGFHLLRP